MKEFAHTLLAAEIDAMPCAECQTHLPDYVDAQLLGREAASEVLAAVAHHLRFCPHCAHDYRELRALLDIAYAIDLEVPAAIPAVNLAYLTTPPTTTSDKQSEALWQRLAGNVNRVVGAIHVLLDRTQTHFGALPGGLTPNLMPTPVQRGPQVSPAAQENFVEILELPDPVANRLIRVRVASAQAGRGALLLEVHELAPLQSISQARVTLNDNNGELLESTATQPDGKVFFRDLDPGDYLIQVEHQGTTTELTIVLSVI
jgi:hypothetical protein